MRAAQGMQQYGTVSDALIKQHLNHARQAERDGGTISNGLPSSLAYTRDI